MSSYTHIQCIGYQVPTVAKVFDNNPPSNNPVVPNVGVVGFPQMYLLINNIVNGGTIFYLYDTTNNNTFNSPPTSNVDYQVWLSHVKSYLGALIGYLEDSNHATTTEIDAMITYLKYHTRWGDWNIPSGSGTSGVDAVEISQIRDNNNQFVDAYTLRDSDPNNTNLTLLNQAGNIDAKNRVIRFLNVLYRATSYYIDQRETTLKVFTAPEFYFRPEATVANSSVYRAYTYDVYKAIKAVLRQTIQNMELNHWLIIPGTIMWYMPAHTQANNKKVDINTYFNSCIYIHNRTEMFGTDVHLSHKVEKSVASHIDGIPYNNWDYGSNAPKISQKYTDLHNLEKHVLPPINGVQVGLEICLEHKMYPSPVKIWDNTVSPPKLLDLSYGVLKNVFYKLLSRHKRKRHDLQLLVSGGMPEHSNSIVLTDYRIFFRNDGLNKGTDYVYNGTWSTSTKKLTAPSFKFSFSINNVPSLELQAPDTSGTLELLPGMPFDQQKIVIFPTQKI